jgi:8-oxo-dGTP pyrophosphatase MutT (NUDIX family)
MENAKIRAAGGVMLRQAAGKPEVLVIHRQRYDDWTLPKGKLQAGESAEQAAIREVREETGYAVRLGAKIGDVHYLVNGVPKTVQFWHLLPKGERGPIEDTGEIREAVWMAAHDALIRLSYELEREVLTKALVRGGRVTFLRRMFSSPAYRRFEREHGIFKIELAARQVTADQQCAAKTAKLLLEAAEITALKDVDSAWVYLDVSRRLAILTLGPGELKSREWLIRCEVEQKLKEWRKCSAVKLLKDSDPKDLSQTLYDVQWLLDDAFHTQYHRNKLLAHQLRNLVLVSACSLTSLLVLVGMSGTSPTSWGEWDWKKLLMVLLLGVLGACFSATTKMTGSGQSDQKGNQTKDKIPDLVSKGWVTLARIVLGATPALAAYAFLQSGVLNIGDNGIGAILATAFGAGFSERWVLKLLKALSGGGEDKTEAPPPGAGTQTMVASTGAQIRVPQAAAEAHQTATQGSN